MIFSGNIALSISYAQFAAFMGLQSHMLNMLTMHHMLCECIFIIYQSAS